MKKIPLLLSFVLALSACTDEDDEEFYPELSGLYECEVHTYYPARSYLDFDILYTYPADTIVSDSTVFISFSSYTDIDMSGLDNITIAYDTENSSIVGTSINTISGDPYITMEGTLNETGLNCYRNRIQLFQSGFPSDINGDGIIQSDDYSEEGVSIINLTDNYYCVKQ